MATGCAAFDGKNFSRSTLVALYGADADKNSPRFGVLARQHEQLFGAACADFFSSPGRIEIVGNHTDHNAGKVLAAAISVDTLAAVSPRADGIIEVKSEDYPAMRIDVSTPMFPRAAAFLPPVPSNSSLRKSSMSITTAARSLPCSRRALRSTPRMSISANPRDSWTRRQSRSAASI